MTTTWIGGEWPFQKINFINGFKHFIRATISKCQNSQINFQVAAKVLESILQIISAQKSKGYFFLTRSKTNFFSDYFSDRCIDFFSGRNRSLLRADKKLKQHLFLKCENQGHKMIKPPWKILKTYVVACEVFSRNGGEK